MGRKNSKAQGVPVSELEVRGQKHYFAVLGDGQVHRVKAIAKISPGRWRVKIRRDTFAVMDEDVLFATEEGVFRPPTTEGASGAIGQVAALSVPFPASSEPLDASPSPAPSSRPPRVFVLDVPHRRPSSTAPPVGPKFRITTYFRPGKNPGAQFG